MELITRKQLCELGLTKYQAQRLTKEIHPIQKIDRSNAYSVQEIIVAINQYIENKKAKVSTKYKLNQIKEILIPTLDNLIPVAFGAENSSELEKLVQQAQSSKLKINRKLAKMKRRALEIQGRYE